MDHMQHHEVYYCSISVKYSNRLEDIQIKFILKIIRQYVNMYQITHINSRSSDIRPRNIFIPMNNVFLSYNHIKLSN